MQAVIDMADAVREMREMIASLDSSQPLYSMIAMRALVADYTDASATWYCEVARYDVEDDAYEIVAAWNQEVAGYAREASACAADADTFGVTMY
jgi:hypothetical protein